MESEEPNRSAPCFILAVMLERKRILRHRDTIRNNNGQEVLVYEHAETGESFSLVDPHLRLDHLESIQRQIVDLLQPVTEPVG